MTVEVKSLAQMLIDLSVSWIDFSKVDCEECEYQAIQQFLNDSMRLWGRIPVTQLKLELHVPARSFNEDRERGLVHSYGRNGLLRGKTFPGNYNNPQSVALDLKAQAVLASLRAHGFVPFHVHFTDSVGLLC